MNVGLGFAVALILGVFGWAIFGERIEGKIRGRQ